ncbi:MAG: UDP-N-acetylmuramoyl-L-alanine--D-glutamate ligase [Deltaproteobacteria bacterium]|nr:MAG: UDP-N-acetylmuramoyl-L-alanine--D-glutamate ligase [Deltaproteobacteria bacterium]
MGRAEGYRSFLDHSNNPCPYSHEYFEVKMKNYLELKGKNIVVVGLGVSGYWAARWLASIGVRVTVSEAKHDRELDPAVLEPLLHMGVKVETGGHRKDTFERADAVVISPGVPHEMDVLDKARKKGVWVTGELELASRFIQAPIVAVTGTNGKSTVTSMIGQALKMGGLNTYVGGNIGTPLSALLAQGLNPDVVVAEVSSFQLDTIESFCPKVALVLNITRDHLDRYKGFGGYVESKLRIFQNQEEEDCAIICDDDPILSALELPRTRRLLRYGITKKRDRDAYVHQDSILVRNGKFHKFSTKHYRLPGIHNMQNLLAVGLTCTFLGVDPEIFQSAIRHFKPLPHRMEWVGETNGISFYNDSKATNVDAVVRAIEGFERPIILIAGGRHKGASYEPLAKVAKQHIKVAILIGEAAELIEEALGRVVPCYRVESMDKAVMEAYRKADPGDIVLLSPACSSFDMFLDYKDRGEKFKEAVRRITNGQE